MTEAQFIETQQAKQDAALASQLTRVLKTGRIGWGKAEALLAHGLISGAMQNYTLTDAGLAKLEGVK